MLQEAQLLDSKVCTLASTAALLIELRTSLQFDAGNSALLAVRGLRSFDWSISVARLGLAALSVVSSVPGYGVDGFRIDVGFFPDAELIVRGDSAEFYVLDVIGIGEVPPDYVNADFASVEGELPSWSSVCGVIQTSISR